METQQAEAHLRILGYIKVSNDPLTYRDPLTNVEILLSVDHWLYIINYEKYRKKTEELVDFLNKTKNGHGSSLHTRFCFKCP